MKPKLGVVLLFLAVLGLSLSSVADAARTKVVHRGPHGRTKVVLYTGHPIRRHLPHVVVHPARVAVRVAPRVFLAPVVWTTVTVVRPEPDYIVWQDAETIWKDEDWTDVTLNADARGEKLYLEVVAGRAQVNFAEVVYENGDCQVVDFTEKTLSPGTYSLLDFPDGRKIDHVRLIARAKSDEARIALLLRK